MAVWVKICGIRSPEDADCVAAAGGSAIGINFYPRSKRFVTPDAAREIAEAVRERLEVVGVFVNSAPDDVAAIVHRVGLTAVQFHGDESVEQLNVFCEQCPETPLIRALRLGDGCANYESQLRSLAEMKRPADAILVDAFVSGEYGGTGRGISRELLPVDRSSRELFILAGGLTPENVAAAIERFNPWGVDTASGVEMVPGKKSADKVRAFIRACGGGDPSKRLCGMSERT